MCRRNFCNFPWWLRNVKSRWKISIFSNERHFEIWFPKKITITFFWSKYLNYTKKTQFCMWQGIFQQLVPEGAPWNPHFPDRFYFVMNTTLFIYNKPKNNHIQYEWHSITMCYWNTKYSKIFTRRFNHLIFNPSSPKEGCNNPPNSFRSGALKTRSQWI